MAQNLNQEDSFKFYEEKWEFLSQKFFQLKTVEKEWNQTAVNLKFLCKLCATASSKTIYASGSSVSNLKRHIERVHTRHLKEDASLLTEHQSKTARKRLGEVLPETEAKKTIKNQQLHQNQLCIAKDFK